MDTVDSLYISEADAELSVLGMREMMDIAEQEQQDLAQVRCSIVDARA